MRAGFGLSEWMDDDASSGVETEAVFATSRKMDERTREKMNTMMVQTTFKVSEKSWWEARQEKRKQEALEAERQQSDKRSRDMLLKSSVVTLAPIALHKGWMYKRSTGFWKKFDRRYWLVIPGELPGTRLMLYFESNKGKNTVAHGYLESKRDGTFRWADQVKDLSKSDRKQWPYNFQITGGSSLDGDVRHMICAADSEQSKQTWKTVCAEKPMKGSGKWASAPGSKEETKGVPGISNELVNDYFDHMLTEMGVKPESAVGIDMRRQSSKQKWEIVQNHRLQEAAIRKASGEMAPKKPQEDSHHHTPPVPSSPALVASRYISVDLGLGHGAQIYENMKNSDLTVSHETRAGKGRTDGRLVKAGKVSWEAAVIFFTAHGVERSDLSKVWVANDEDGNGFLDQREFIQAFPYRVLKAKPAEAQTKSPPEAVPVRQPAKEQELQLQLSAQIGAAKMSPRRKKVLRNKMKTAGLLVGLRLLCAHASSSFTRAWVLC